MIHSLADTLYVTRKGPPEVRSGVGSKEKAITGPSKRIRRRRRITARLRLLALTEESVSFLRRQRESLGSASGS